MNNLMKIFMIALAGSLFLTACSKDENFFASAGTLPSNFTSRTVAIVEADVSDNVKRQQLDTVARDYLTSVVGELEIVDDLSWGVLGGSSSLTSSDGVFLAYSSFVDRGNIVVGILSTTDVGPAFTEANPTATFTGEYMLAVIGTVTAPSYEELGEPITLTADFGSGTLRGSGNSDAGSILTVAGRFSGKTLSGNVNFSPLGAARSYDAPLRGLIGRNGAVGAFATHSNKGKSADYAFGGGFLVQR